ncbi:hypothetical protein D9613_001127 [Agrocybe pediades]|uniref:Uncharacterized protein n=1 Tax=Agrocybe pediades TaxID=84607 RepID=A0A8H4R0H1_9AGAR|nr:hypothetical protein D9613_001127 [Agrocybe pediades]
MTCSSITAPALSFDVTPPIPVPSTARSLRAQSSASLLKLGGSSSSSTARRSSKGKKKADSEELGPERSDNLGISLGLTPFMAHQDYMFNQNRLVANEALMADAESLKIPRLQEDDIKGSTKLKRVLQGFTVSHPTGTLIENEYVSGFPKLVKTRRCSSLNLEWDTYSRLLLQSGSGFPLDPTFTRKVDSSDIGSGITIGDVSFIDQAFGFSPQFNVFLPADHPVNAQAPPNFSSLGPLDPEEMSSAPEYFPAGTAIVSKGVDVTRSPEDPSYY